jgi:diguanylate cyclase (GGDEF)-like protein
MTSLNAAVDYWAVALSLALGGLTAYVSLDLAKRIRSTDRLVSILWHAGGSVACGTGIWAAHFVGMYAHVLPVPIGYSATLLFVSWILAVLAAAAAFLLVMQSRLGIVALAGGATIETLSLGAMHRTVLASIDFTPDFTWDPALLSLTMVAGFAAATVWLASFPALRTRGGWRGIPLQVAAAVLVALAFGVAFTLAAASVSLPPNVMSLSVFDVEGGFLRDLIAITVPLLLGCTLMSGIIYGFVDRRRAALAGSLEHVAARLVSANDELRQRAMLDPLTGLPNRLLFEDRLAQALLRADRAAKSVRGLREKLAVLFIDIDGFKAVNDSFGHSAGDVVIREVGVRLAQAARNDDSVSRIGGDQFLVLMEGATSSNDCVALAMRVLDCMKMPLEIAGRHVQISVSIGVVVYPDHGERNKLLGQADAAMQAAKRAGRGTYALFESHMHSDMADQLDLINDLRQAIDLGQLELHYQPKVDGRRHLICGVEALLRWHHPTRGSIAPGVFIPLAERFGLINALGNWVIENACAQMAAWARDRVRMRVAINLSVHQLREPDLVARIQSALDRHHVKSSQLLCEITESVAMQDIAATQRTLDDLGKIGVYLSIDDFGTGYSSLSYLRQLPARQLKIDRTFINDLDGSDDAKAVVDGVVRLAHALGLRVVAEGVETATQRDILLSLDCDELQGYFFARPMSADKLLAWTLGHKPKGSVDFAESILHRPIEV